MSDVCIACGKPVIYFNYSKSQGRVGSQMAWRHQSRWIKHKPIVKGMLRDE